MKHGAKSRQVAKLAPSDDESVLIHCYSMNRYAYVVQTGVETPNDFSLGVL